MRQEVRVMQALLIPSVGAKIAVLLMPDRRSHQEHLEFGHCSAQGDNTSSFVF